MSDLDIIRAWKDKTYRNSLSAEQLAQLPEHPAGSIELTDDELTSIDGAAATPSIIPLTLLCTITYCTITYCTITVCSLTACTFTYCTAPTPVNAANT